MRSSWAMVSACNGIWLLPALLANFAICDESVFFPGSGASNRKQDFQSEESQESSTCKTLSGAVCIFPFKFEGVLYEACTSAKDPDNKLWCSTKVNADGDHITGGGFWGHCNLDDGSDCPYVETFRSCTTSKGASGECRPATLCVGVRKDDESSDRCVIEDGSAGGRRGVCCPDRVKNDITIQISDFKFDDIATATSVSVDDVSNFIGSRILLDSVGGKSPSPDDGAELDEAEAFHLQFNRPVSDSLFIDQRARDLLRTASGLQADNALSSAEAGIGLRMFDSDSSQAIDDICPWTPAPRCGSGGGGGATYRALDGTCNNLREGNYGRAMTPYQRILLPEYGDGTIHLPRRSRSGNVELPSARQLSQRMTGDSNVADDIQTVLVMQMGQFVDHDLTSTPTSSSKCCSKESSSTSFDGDKCFPIPIPEDDPFWRGRKTCMSFARSLASPGLKCELEFRQQMNQITHWLDGSNIYGSSDEAAAQLRSFIGGKLKDTARSRRHGNSLPSCNRQRNPDEIPMCRDCKTCFIAGDSRANEQINLAVMHTIWMREHNRIASDLRKLNPSWDDEKLYQEARRINVAQYQHIVYKEWLPLVLGHDFMDKFGLWPLSKGYSDAYMDTFDPRITNEFAAAAFRFGHSLIPDVFKRVPQSGTVGGQQGRTAALSMKDVFFKPDALRTNGAMFDELVRGMVSQEGELWDNAFVSSIRDHLFESSTDNGGLDIVALNIQRGRDHGLPGYNSYRAICDTGSGRARDFSDFEDYIPKPHVDKLRLMYRSADDVDLYVGGFLETPHADSILGPTFKCIIGDQFARLKLGDRFFYDLGRDPNTRFTAEQLQEIRKTSMARVLCDNTESLRSIQPMAFKLPGSSAANSPESCRSRNIPSMNLRAWRGS